MPQTAARARSSIERDCLPSAFIGAFIPTTHTKYLEMTQAGTPDIAFASALISEHQVTRHWHFVDRLFHHLVLQRHSLSGLRFDKRAILPLIVVDLAPCHKSGRWQAQGQRDDDDGDD